MNKDYKELIEYLDKKFNKAEEDVAEFKKDVLDFQDKALKDLEDLKQEKTVGDEQNKRQKSVLEIHNNALKKNKILSDVEILEVSKLQAF